MIRERIVVAGGTKDSLLSKVLQMYAGLTLSVAVAKVRYKRSRIRFESQPIVVEALQSNQKRAFSQKKTKNNVSNSAYSTKEFGGY